MISNRFCSKGIALIGSWPSLQGMQAAEMIHAAETICAAFGTVALSQCSTQLKCHYLMLLYYQVCDCRTVMLRGDRQGNGKSIYPLKLCIQVRLYHTYLKSPVCRTLPQTPSNKSMTAPCTGSKHEKWDAEAVMPNAGVYVGNVQGNGWLQSL